MSVLYRVTVEVLGADGVLVYLARSEPDATLDAASRAALTDLEQTSTEQSARLDTQADDARAVEAEAKRFREASAASGEPR